MIQIFNLFKETKDSTVDDIRKEIFGILSDIKNKEGYEFVYTGKDNLNKLFKHGCDFIVKQFDVGRVYGAVNLHFIDD